MILEWITIIILGLGGAAFLKLFSTLLISEVEKKARKPQHDSSVKKLDVGDLRFDWHKAPYVKKEPDTMLDLVGPGRGIK